MDLWGRIYLDHWHGELHPHDFFRDDGKTQRVPSAASYFEAPRNAVERHALETLTGRVLDLGCGAGSYTRFLESRGLTVTSIDISPGAITVCRERGCKDARVANIDALRVICDRSTRSSAWATHSASASVPRRCPADSNLFAHCVDLPGASSR